MGKLYLLDDRRWCSIIWSGSQTHLIVSLEDGELYILADGRWCGVVFKAQVVNLACCARLLPLQRAAALVVTLLKDISVPVRRAGLLFLCCV